MQTRGLGDKLSAAQVSALQNQTFFGNDVDPKMVRLATMNLTLRGLPNVRILLRNVLTTTLDAERKAELGLPQEGYHVVLANPPFSGRVDKDRIVDDVKVGTTTATELLFLKYMMDSLRPGGRCGVIVPEGVLFGSTGAHKELRRQLIENNRVEAVMSLPGGVFQPYSGVKTSVLFFRKGGKTENVLFLHADNDGYKLDANHDTADRGRRSAGADRGLSRPRGRARRRGRSAIRRPNGPRNGGLRMRRRCARTTSISPPGATAR